jgi:hypothetical protein
MAYLGTYFICWYFGLTQSGMQHTIYLPQAQQRPFTFFWNTNKGKNFSALVRVSTNQIFLYLITYQPSLIACPVPETRLGRNKNEFEWI